MQGYVVGLSGKLEEFTKYLVSQPYRFRPRHLAGGLFSWISQVNSYSDEEIARVAGFDGLAYIKFLGLCLRIAAGVMYARPLPTCAIIVIGIRSVLHATQCWEGLICMHICDLFV